MTVQHGAYTNSSKSADVEEDEIVLIWTVFCITSARAGWDDGIHHLIPGSMIVDPEGHIVAESKTEDDELVIAEIDLDECKQGKERTFNLAKHRRPEQYSLLVETEGLKVPVEP